MRALDITSMQHRSSRLIGVIVFLIMEGILAVLCIVGDNTLPALLGVDPSWPVGTAVVALSAAVGVGVLDLKVAGNRTRVPWSLRHGVRLWHFEIIFFFLARCGDVIIRSKGHPFDHLTLAAPLAIGALRIGVAFGAYGEKVPGLLSIAFWSCVLSATCGLLPISDGWWPVVPLSVCLLAAIILFGVQQIDSARGRVKAGVGVLAWGWGAVCNVGLLYIISSSWGATWAWFLGAATGIGAAIWLLVVAAD